MKTDTEQITDLIYAYAERLDLGDLEGVAKLFQRATLRSHGHPSTRSGSAEVLHLYRAKVKFYDGVPCTKHVTTNLMVDVSEHTAAARSYFTVMQARPELPLQPIIAGRYHDRFERDAAGWFFRDRLIIVDLVGDLRFHLAP